MTGRSGCLHITFLESFAKIERAIKFYKVKDSDLTERKTLSPVLTRSAKIMFVLKRSST